MRIEMQTRHIASGDDLRAGYQAAHDRLWGARPEPARWKPLLKLVKPEPIEVVEIPPPPPPDPEVVALNELIRPLQSKVRVIHRIVAAHYGVTLLEIKAHGRLIKYVTPRHVAAYICLEHFGISSPVVGRYTRRDHSTTFHARRCIEDRMTRDAAFADEVMSLVALCRSPAE